MATARAARSDGKTRLILAAEQLFAKGGIDGVSLREIAAAAGQGNHHAVQYHFGSREGLVHAIFVHRMQQMEARRGEMLAAAEAAGRLSDARAIVEIIFLPQLELPGQRDNHSYAYFLLLYLLRNDGRDFGDFGAELPPNIARALQLLRQRLDFLPEHIAQRRLVTACFMFLNMLTAYADDRVRSSDDESFEDAVDDTLGQIVLATCMPLGSARV
ncbi:TetR/AcrR family transcriptional regulator [Sphingomonas sp. CL5.1]|uniref:TetR/AcrR family transcriptional regulator n=1 Tax=Sphingomonas sp. CL5.1 TaxID=2653203 RepID=UPI0020C6A929|nr:TetR/AcrR family transcriptional regulator [Sphingomonas sp. CL5.1]